MADTVSLELIHVLGVPGGKAGTTNAVESMLLLCSTTLKPVFSSQIKSPVAKKHASMGCHVLGASQPANKQMPGVIRFHLSK